LDRWYLTLLQIMPRTFILLVILLLAPPAQREPEWTTPGGDPGARRFSALTQITRENVSTLQQAWSFDTGATNLQGTPTLAGGLMYVTGGRSVFALEPETGKQVWRFDAQKRTARRGVAYWPGTGPVTPRVYVGVDDGRLMALDARTGEPIAGFGGAGGVDLKASIGGEGPFMLESPPIVYRNILITGGANTEGEPSTGLYGDIRGWDAQSGKLLWSFHTVPRTGEPGVETWDGESWKNRSGVNAWTYLTLDADRGLVFAATGSATSDFYGADRRGKNLYANSVIALDAATGRLRWHQQLVHHDLWDWDLPAAPALIEVTRGGRTIPAVAQMTKMSLLFIFDRTNDMYALTPEHAAYCRDLWDKNRMFAAAMFTPSPLEGTMVMFPSTLGGGNWSGLSYDPGRKLLFTNIMNLGQVARMEPRDPADGRGPYRRTSPWKSAYGRFWNPETKMPCSAPPFGELVAIDVNEARVAWRVPIGVFESLKERGFGATGTPNIGGTIATASGVIFIGATIDRRFRAFDAENGKLLWETTLPASAHATPMTFMGRDRRQYVVVAAGGDGLLQSPTGTQIVAFALAR
jgi:quinoprotein glucose dehydrogenase